MTTHTPDAASSADSPVDTAALLDLARRAASAAGAELMRRYGHIEGLRTKSTATDPVSAADLAAEAVLVEMITTERPDDGLLAEEGSSRPSVSGLRWVVDPLDGTVNYLYGLGNFSVSVAVEDGDGALVGVVLDPGTGREYSAVRGEGAFCDGERLQVVDPIPMGQALLGTGFGYDPARRALQGQVIAALLPTVRDIRRTGSAALDMCWVASGKLDAFYEVGLQPWDAAAGGLIAQEAGAVFTALVQLPGGPTRFLTAGPSLHHELSSALAELPVVT
ncbi:inositol monophosphatase [Nakamurella flavida]|uniref:Inositol-1-monophosphatase n=1 Tax=Nakamurella flavida TaxID=363630 RepID=A0A939C1I2_9ACTN|nr:inositol monophosphatase family protein [Nakamurella flavida]MBM9477718.1 inositol monophosphatase [Nakamurella flavida]MDP9779270.1 myo-inositol-1(or 4)-monophosphatase [Nakamurella flavida]